MSYKWSVVPLCKRQLRDVNPSDILCNGLYRRCDIYKGGGGYDKFEAIYHRRFGVDTPLNEQFVVQLKGCPFKCPYCYVTQDGIWGESTPVDTVQLVADFVDSSFPVFHLMGGAPALYLKHWPEILEALPRQSVFHSDFLLQEGYYDIRDIKKIARYKNQLHAVSIKGADESEYKANTGVVPHMERLWKNLDTLWQYGPQFYLTFTGMSQESIDKFSETAERLFGKEVLADSFSIDIIHYDALD